MRRPVRRARGVTAGAAYAAVLLAAAGRAWGGYGLWGWEAAEGAAGACGGGAGQLALLGPGRVPELGPDAPDLELSVEAGGSDWLRVTVRAPGAWEVPENVVPRGTQSSADLKGPCMASFWHSPSSPFEFGVGRGGGSAAANGATLWNSTGFDLIYKDKYLEFSSSLEPEAEIFGLGERTRPGGLALPRDGRREAIWARDIAAFNTDQNLYGSHPYFLQMSAGGQAHGVLLLSSSGMDVEAGRSYITYRVLGGVCDLYFFPGPTPEDVTRQYAALVGKPAMPPMWSLGFHQSKWGYSSVERLREVVQGYRQARIPLDTIWSDIDYMQGYRDFTFDSEKFPAAEMEGFVRGLHADGQHYVAITDAGIKVDGSGNYSTYNDLLESGCYIRDNTGESPYHGWVWPGDVLYPDFLHPAAQPFWTQQLGRYIGEVDVDGIWLDMNEASNFCSGLCSGPDPECPGGCCLKCSADDTPFGSPTYGINNGDTYDALWSRAIAPSALHYGSVREFYAHNFFGHTEAQATRTALLHLRPQRRPFIISRSTFLGSGSVTGHWTGDNAATWDDLKYSISGVLNSNLFGIPMVGADTCGFSGDTTEELCARWITLSAMAYTFSRNHADLNSAPQELYQWESVARAARKSLDMRLQLLPYIYAQFYRASLNGGTVLRPLFFEFPGVIETWKISSQLMVGASILVSPVLEGKTDSVSAFFPEGVWWNPFSRETLVIETPGYRLLNASMEEIPVHFRGGTVLPMFAPGAMSVAEARSSAVSLVAVLDRFFSEDDEEQVYLTANPSCAEGFLYLDDGEEPDLMKAKATEVQYNVSVDSAGGLLLANIIRVDDVESGRLPYGSFTVIGVPTVESVQVNGVPVPTSSWSYRDGTLIVICNDCGISVGQALLLSWKHAVRTPSTSAQSARSLLRGEMLTT